MEESPLALTHGRHVHANSNALAELESKVAALTAKVEALSSDVQATTGEGKAVFSWDQELTAAFPADAKQFEHKLHGGFNEDADTGIVYTGIPGYGLCSISPDLKSWTKLGSDERLKGNIHGIVVFKHKGSTYIAVAQNEDSRVLVVGLDGNVLQELNMPSGGEFNFDSANAYYSNRPSRTYIKPFDFFSPNKPSFACTDVTYLDGKLYVVTGYCDGDFVLTASDDGAGKWQWGPTAWGGKGDAPGQFQTAHGVFAHDGHIFVANREAHQVIEFTKEGKLVSLMPDIPDKARICNVAYADDHQYFVMNALEPIQHQPHKTASIYAHSGEELLATIYPGSLGIPVLKHLHHVWPHYVQQADGSRRLHLLVSGWCNGKFAVLKHEPDVAAK